MTYTEKILEEFYKTKPFIVPNGGDIRKVEISYEDWLWIENFLSTSIAQALAEERERMRGEIEGLRLNPAKIDLKRLAEYHAHNDLLNDLLSSLDTNPK